jgi:MerR family transcriptional regulator, copper efflux regulator
MRIGELAKRAGVGTSKLRFYKARGVLLPGVRSENGYRYYGDHALEVVRFTTLAQSLGFTLWDVAAHLRSPEDGGRKARLQAKLEANLVELDAHIERAQARRMVVLKLIGEVREARAGRGSPFKSGGLQGVAS